MVMLSMHLANQDTSHHTTYGTLGGAFLPCGVLSLKTRKKERYEKLKQSGWQKAEYERKKRS